MLTIVAHIHAKTEKAGLVREDLPKLVSLSRAEEGCIRYDPHVANDDPAHFMVYENWTSRALWQRPMDSQHSAACRKATERAVAAFRLFGMTRIG